MENNWKDELINLTLLEMLRLKGFNKVNSTAFSLLREVMIQKTQDLMIKIKEFVELNQRHEVSFFDVLNVIESKEGGVTKLTTHLRKTSQQYENSDKLISKVIKEMTEQDNTLELVDEAELEVKPVRKKIVIKTAYPSGFLKNMKDREKTFFMSFPDEMCLKQTDKLDQMEIKNSEIKNLRIQEKRNFELENCKLKAFKKDSETEMKSSKETPQPKELSIKLSKLKLEKINPFGEESEMIDNLNVFEVSNSQLF